MVAPFLRDSARDWSHIVIGIGIGGRSGAGIMIILFISSLSDDVINAVLQTLRDMQRTRRDATETIRQVVLPAALPGIVSAILLATVAIGETMIVVMALVAPI